MSRGQYTSKHSDCGLQTLWFVILSDPELAEGEPKDLRLFFWPRPRNPRHRPHALAQQEPLASHRDKAAMNGATGDEVI